VKKYLKNPNPFHHSKAIILSEMEVQDIDTEEDWKMAELKFINLKSK
jgi:CMP-N-acetylneuraminic acid synthetase